MLLISRGRAGRRGKGRGQANGRFINNSYECAYKKLKNRLSAKKDKKKQRKREEISTAKKKKKKKKEKKVKKKK